jgi:hypothetical protein
VSLLTGYFPADARLILSPSSYVAGGTDLGKLASIQAVDITHDMEFVNEHVSGSTLTGARMTGTRATLLVAVEDWSEALMDVLNNHTNNGTDWDGFTGYNMGDFMDDDQFSRLQVRPVDKAGAVITTKPHVYIPRAVTIRGFNPVWGRRVKHTEAFQLLITAIKHPSYATPVLYGDATTLPEIIVPE